MKLLFTATIYFFLVSAVNALRGQTNLIKNHSFENGNASQLVNSNNIRKGYLNDWESRGVGCDEEEENGGIEIYEPHSPDWFSDDVSYSQMLKEQSSYSGKKCVGAGPWELFQQILGDPLSTSSPLKPGRPYYLSFHYLAQSNFFVAPDGQTIQTDKYEPKNTSIAVYLFQTKAKYRNENCDEDEMCTLDYLSFEANNEKTEIARFPIEDGEENINKWIKKEKIFMAPSNNLNWLVIQIENNYSGILNTPNCQKPGYVLFDDFQLYGFCELPCAPEFEDFEIFTQPNATFTFTETCNVAPLINGVAAHPATWSFGNVMGYEFRVFDGFGGQLYECFEYDLNGLINPEINVAFPNRQNPWAFSWNGNDRTNLNLPDDVYAFRLDIWNCQNKQEVTFSDIGTITKVGSCDQGVPLQIPCFSSLDFDLSDCCADCMTLTNFPLSNNRIDKSTKNCINLNGGFEMEPSNNANLEAGEIITFTSEVSIHEGANLAATIDDCSNPINIFFRKPDYPSFLIDALISNEQNLISREKIYTLHPNPHREQFTLSQTEEGYIKSYKIIDVMGRVMLSATFGIGKETSINTSNLAKGIYILHLETTQGLKAERIVKE